MEDNKSNLTSKLKNKKKDIILADNLTEQPNINTNKDSKEDQNSNKSKEENPLLKDAEKFIPTEKKEEISKIQNLEINSSENKDKKDEKIQNQNLELEKNIANNEIMNKIIFQIQLYFSQNKNIDIKIYNLFVTYLSVDHLKAVLEERDCIEICGNILCNKKIGKSKNKKYFYNSKLKDFVKEDVLNFFCDVRCFQKFKDAIKIANDFDFLRLFRFESLYVFNNLKNYFIEDINLKKICHIAKGLYEISLKKVDEIKLDLLKIKYDNYFSEIQDEATITNKDGYIDLNKVFEEKMNIN